MIPDLTSPAGAAANLRRSAVVAGLVGVVAVALLAPFGYLAMALFGCLGLGLGLLNMVLVRRSAALFAISDGSNKRGFALGVLGRLTVVTVLALGFALLVRPDGLGVFVGLVAFQLIMIATASIPMLKELRQSGAKA